MTATTPEVLEQMKQAAPIAGVDEKILRRWSPRAFSSRPVTAEELAKLFEAARWAASSSNEQPWRFIVGRKGDATYSKIFDALAEGNRIWAGNAPVLILSVAKKNFSQSNAPNYHALHDTGAATATLSLQATAMGLHTHPMAGFDHQKIRASLGIPDDYEMGAVTAIGYLGDAAMLPEKLRERETVPRSRRPLRELVFSAWNKPFAL